MTTAPINGILPVNADGIPAEIKGVAQWVLWRVERRDNKPTKVPYAPDGAHYAKTNDASTWGTIDDVFARYLTGDFSGVGFVFTADDDYCGIDLDGCRDPETGAVDEWAQAVLDTFPTYSEISPTGSGIKLFLRGGLPTKKTGEKTKEHNRPPGGGHGGKTPGIETYHRGRFFAVTGHRLDGSPAEIVECNGELTEWFRRTFTPKPAAKPNGRPNATNGGHRERDNRTLINRAKAYLRKLPEAVSGQRGHDRAFHAACVLRCGFGLSFDEAWEAIQEWNATCVPPWSENELRHKLEDAGKEPVTNWLLDTERPRKKTTGQGSNDYISNAVEVPSEGGKIQIQPLCMEQIVKSIRDRTGDWPRRVGAALFVHPVAGEIQWLQSPSALFGWLGATCPPPAKFHRRSDCHSREEVFSEMMRTATSYESVEVMPHEPPMAGHYYACSIPAVGNGDALRKLVEFFNPATDVDADLITALFVTPTWGGRGGSRPVFSITSDDGRGVGKSTLGALAGYLYRGSIELSANEDAEEIKKRLLSPEGLTKRVAVLDNVKTRCFSWAELESLVTAPVISGKRMYVGEGSRPNNLTWIVTMNGGSYSTDLAQRSVFIKLKRPNHSGNWEETVREFIDANRQNLIGDIIGFLRWDRCNLHRYSRWGAWERDVLSRLPDPAEAQKVIFERQGAADVEIEEADLIEDYFRQQLAGLGYDADMDRVFIPSVVVCTWLGAALNDRFTTTAATRSINQKITEGKLHRLQANPCKSHGRGLAWTGENWNPETATKTDIETRIEHYKSQSSKASF